MTTFAEKSLEIESLTLQNRLTRGGLAPEAVQKALEAFEAGDIHALNFSKAGGRLICPIPQELLVRVFPKLAEIPVKATVKDLDHLSLEYEINRHHGGLKSLTLKWPEENDPSNEEAKPEEAKLSLTEHAAAKRDPSAVYKDQDGKVISGDQEVPTKKGPPAEVPHAPVPEIPEKTGTGAMSRGSYPGRHPDDTKPAPEPLPAGRKTEPDDDDTPF